MAREGRTGLDRCLGGGSGVWAGLGSRSSTCPSRGYEPTRREGLRARAVGLPSSPPSPFSLLTSFWNQLGYLED